MKYDDNVFGLSNDIYHNIQLNEKIIDKETLKVEKKLLKILLKKFKEQATKIKDENDILKIRIKSNFWQDSEEGYDEITKLIKKNIFDSFASQFCFYLGNVESRYDEYYTSYYEIIWDYKTYFEQVNSKKLVIEDIPVDCKETYIKAISSFKKLPLKYQTQVLKAFTNKVKKYEKENASTIKVNVCKSEGHIFGDWEKKKYSTWEKNTYLGSKDCVIPEGCETIKVNHVKWERKCFRCGFSEIVMKEPQDLIAKRKKQEKNAEIKKLEKKLNLLKGK